MASATKGQADGEKKKSAPSPFRSIIAGSTAGAIEIGRPNCVASEIVNLVNKHFSSHYLSGRMYDRALPSRSQIANIS